MYHEWALANSRTNFLFYFRDLSPSLSTLFVLLYCEVPVCVHFSPGSARRALGGLHFACGPDFEQGRGGAGATFPYRRRN